MTTELVGKAWFEVLENEFKQPYFTELRSTLQKEYKTVKIYPSPSKIFRAFQLTDPTTIKIIICLQDPYPFGDSQGNPHADGLALSSQSSETPASLRTVLREVDRDVVKTNSIQEFRVAFPTNDLSSWAKQGILLLNTALTVRAGLPNSHQEIGWHIFIKSVLKILTNDNQFKVFCTWGKNAREIIQGVNFQPNHKILDAGHPASGSHGKDLFSGCNHFSKINYYFWRNEVEEINWKLDGNNI